MEEIGPGPYMRWKIAATHESYRANKHVQLWNFWIGTEWSSSRPIKKTLGSHLLQFNSKDILK
jgi:hypothetical protein